MARKKKDSAPEYRERDARKLLKNIFEGDETGLKVPTPTKICFVASDWSDPESGPGWLANWEKLPDDEVIKRLDKRTERVRQHTEDLIRAVATRGLGADVLESVAESVLCRIFYFASPQFTDIVEALATMEKDGHLPFGEMQFSFDIEDPIGQFLLVIIENYSSYMRF